MSSVDQYVEEVIGRGDEGSALLAKLCAPTLRNCDYVDVLREGMNGLAVLRTPKEYNVAVHSAAGDPVFSGMPEAHARSLVERLTDQAAAIGAEPLGFANVIDASVGDQELIRGIGGELADAANDYEIGILNGELAILGDRIASPANISGTMISITSEKPGVYKRDGFTYVVFDPKGNAVFINSDGVGTKTEFYERAGTYPRALWDSAAMKADDAVKLGANPRVFFDVVERKGNIPVDELDEEALRIKFEVGAPYLLHHEDVGRNLGGWSDTAFNVSGSVVSTIDEDRLKNPPTPVEGNTIIAIRGAPNPRSNGITEKRKAMIKQFGENWHTTREGRIFLEFLAKPSTLFYPLFKHLIENGLATSVYHMSGGAYNGKLAKPLAKHGLYARLEGLFEPDWRELALAGFTLTPAEAAYAKWPMGNEGFVTTSKPDKAVRAIQRYCLEAREVSCVERNKDGKTGIELAGIRASDGKNVYFSGK